MKKFIYGLKQSGRNWNEKLYAAFIKLGFARFSVDLNLYVFRKELKYVLFLVYVDDIIMVFNAADML